MESPRRKSTEQQREAAERTMRELADVLSQDAKPLADVPFTLQPEADPTPREKQPALFSDDGQPE